MWQDKLKEIIYLLENSEVNEIDLTFWGRRFRVVKSPSLISGGSDAPINNMSTSISPAQNVSAPTETSSTAERESESKVLAPMPGTFYRSSAPDADPYVNEGDQVVKGDTLCIIEAMKIMNEIEAEQNGAIIKILINSGDPVEYDQPLFLIKPSV